MNKKILFTLFVLPFLAKAEDITSAIMLYNNYELRQPKSIWQRMRLGFKLKYQQNKLVNYYEKVYIKNPKSLAKLISAAKPYLYYILTQTERYNLPSELALIPAVESSFNPLAKNPLDPYAGLWQFEPITGRRFKLIQNNDFDERQNVVKSTNAALNYLNYLYLLFGQWDLAIGAYNLGEGSMYKAVINSGQILGNVNYSTLSVRTITAAYVPKIIALANIIRQPEKFGINLEEQDNIPYFAITNPKDTVTINDFAKEITLAKFRILNPEFKHTHFMLSSQNSVLIPVILQKSNNISSISVDNKEIIDDIINNIDVDYYEVKLGETIYSIAKKFAKTIDYIKAINSLETNNLFEGQILKIK